MEIALRTEIRVDRCAAVSSLAESLDISSDRLKARRLGEKQPQHDELVGCEAARANLEMAAKVVNKNFLNLVGDPHDSSENSRAASLGVRGRG